jgi:hypothetical protein
MLKIKFLTLICSLFLFAVSCEKGAINTSPDFVVAKNPDVTVTKPNGVSVTASDVYSRKSSFKRKISILSGRNTGNMPNVYITFISSDNDNIYEKMKTRPTEVNGNLIIETEGQVILTKRVVNGKWGGTKLINPSSVKASAACTVSTVHDCVAWEIDDMNWIEYGACLLSAPGCYATLWASCTWEVCHNHKVYDNPND